MSVWRASLAKEWQAHRRTLGILFILLACMAPLLFLFYPAERIGYREFSFRLGIVGMAVVLVTFAPGLLAQERADVLGRRLPRSFAATFWARILLYVAVQGAAVLWCLALGEALRLFIPERLRLDAVHFWQPVAMFWLLNIGLGFWVMLVGCWLRSAILALPGAALLLALLAVPLYLVHEFCGLLRPSTAESIVLATLFLVTPLLAAFTSYVRGLRFVARPRAPAMVGAATLMILILPLWGWSGMRTWRHLQYSCVDPGVAISSALIGPQGRFAYVTLWRPGAYGWHFQDRSPYAFRLDLSDGTWERRGGRGSYWANVGCADRCEWATGLCGLHPVVCRVVLGGGMHFVDGATGELLRETPLGYWDQELATLIRDTKRSVTPWRNAEGGRAWVMGQGWWQDGPRGELPSAPSFQVEAAARWGTLGGRLVIVRMGTASSERTVLIFDPYRCRAFEERSFGDLGVQAVRPGNWLVRATPPERPQTEEALEPHWLLLDPESGETAAARGLEPGDLVEVVLDGGDVLVIRRADQATGRLIRVSPETGEVQAVTIDGSADRPLCSLMDRSEDITPVRTPDGRRVFLVRDDDERRFFARLEADGTTLTTARGWTGEGPDGLMSWVIACPDDESILVVLEQRKIARLHFGSTRRELLFPRPSP